LITQLQAIVGETRVKTDADSLKTWGCDWTKHYMPAASAIVFPATTEEVQAIVQTRQCQENIVLVPSGGRTGLSAGAVAANGEVVISFDRMNKIVEFYPADRMVKVQAGMLLLSNCNNLPMNKTYIIPLTLPRQVRVKLAAILVLTQVGLKLLNTA
jgi:FAD/FMN-containing dehydrogenase